MSNAVRLRLGGVLECLPRMANTVRLRLGGMLESTGWADAAGWADAICWPAVHRLMQTARSANIRAIAACIGIRALNTLTLEPKLMRAMMTMMMTITALIILVCIR